ncbi:NHL repeat containing protein [Alcanivorax sp. S71-1-4]|uniref:hypothetical protein n=1 Tax=Alcanivorax sp. S71-1-4 TaxID=1177159 RepID=UPI0013588888|nr:hypothetical protein [Alcanivorax sp. S71-1-4]KAF0809143.1 NHL repeat containing protein [Alcanivorax sp. S71-1-4]
MALLTGCGGGGSTGGAPAPAAPTAQIQFPPDNVLYDEAVITVSGVARDAQGDDIVSVHVNEVAAHSDDGFATWSVSLPLTVGENRLVVETLDDSGQHAAEADVVTVQVRAFPALRSVGEGGLVLDKANNRAFVSDGDRRAVYTFDLETGQRTVVTSSRPADKLLNAEPFGSGPEMVLPRHPGLDGPESRVLLISGASRLDRRVMEINPNTGERSVFYSPENTSGSGPAFDLLRSAILDQANNRLLVTEGFNGNMRVLAVDLDTENRTLISGSGRGSGPGLEVTESLYLDAGANRLFAVDNRSVSGPSRRLLSIDLANGNRTVLSSSGENIGTGPAILNATSLDFDSETHRFLIADSSAQRLLTVDRETGDRQVVSGLLEAEMIGEGPALRRLRAARFLDSHRAVAVDDELEVPLMVDLGSGARRLLPSNAIGAGPRFEEPHAMARLGERLVVADQTANALFSVDLKTGDRTVMLGGASSGLREPALLTLDPTANRLLFVDDIAQAPRLMAMDPQTLLLSSVSGPEATGPALSNPVSMVLDAAHHRVLLADAGGQRITAIHLATGERTLLLDDLPVRGIELGASLALGADGNTLFMLAGSSDGFLLSLNLTTGERHTLSGEDPDTGDLIGGPEFALFGCFGIALDEARQRAYVSCPEGNIQQVDLDTGHVSVVSGNSEEINAGGAGPGLVDPVALIADLDNQRLLVLDRAQRAVMTADLRSGDRVVNSWTDVITR